jgi:hypothetical protein
VSSDVILTAARRLEAVREVRGLFNETGQMLVEKLAPDDADRVAQAARTAAGNELSRVFDEARAEMDKALNAR